MKTTLKVPENHMLNNGIEIPSIGFGTYKIDNAETMSIALKAALDFGYRSIDCAAYYGNEKLVGDTLKEIGRPREQLFISSKVWVTEMGYDSTLKSFKSSLENLRLSYLDLYLIHWPMTATQSRDWKRINHDTWRALEYLLSSGDVRAIGVCNFKSNHLDALISDALVMPSVNQIEYHPGLNQTGTLLYCDHHNIRVEAWSPLARGRIMDNSVLTAIAEAHGKSVAQICLRWIMQHGVIPLPKSENPGRILSNIDIFDFALTEAEMRAIDGLDGIDNSGLDPDTVEFT